MYRGYSRAGMLLLLSLMRVLQMRRKGHESELMMNKLRRVKSDHSDHDVMEVLHRKCSPAPTSPPFGGGMLGERGAV